MQNPRAARHKTQKTRRAQAAPATGPGAASAPRPGQRARRSRTVRDEDITQFTAITGDRNPLHYDVELAAASRFGGIVVQGGVTSGLLNAVVAEELPGPGSVFLHVDWSFRAAVRPGDTLTAELEVLTARRDKPVTTLRTTITNQDGVVVLDGTAVVWRDPVVAAATDAAALTALRTEGSPEPTGRPVDLPRAAGPEGLPPAVGPGEGRRKVRGRPSL